MEDARIELPKVIRHRAYLFVLSIYDSLGLVRTPGVLSSDLQSSANRLIAAIARYPVAASKNQLLAAILEELKIVRVFTGLLRDTSLLERSVTDGLMHSGAGLEDQFSSIQRSLSKAPSTFAPKMPLTKIAAPNRQFGKGWAAFNKGGTPEEGTGSYLLGGQVGAPSITAEEAASDGSFSLRQRALLEVLKRRTQVTVGELDTLFSGRVSKKTLQRDLQDLVRRGVIQRKGDRRWTTYFI